MVAAFGLVSEELAVGVGVNPGLKIETWGTRVTDISRSGTKLLNPAYITACNWLVH